MGGHRSTPWTPHATGRHSGALQTDTAAKMSETGVSGNIAFGLSRNTQTQRRFRSSWMSSSSISRPSRRRASRSRFRIVTPLSALRTRSWCMTYSGTLVDKDNSGPLRRAGSCAGTPAGAAACWIVSGFKTRTVPSRTRRLNAAGSSRVSAAANRGSEAGVAGADGLPGMLPISGACKAGRTAFDMLVRLLRRSRLL